MSIFHLFVICTINYIEYIFLCYFWGKLIELFSGLRSDIEFSELKLLAFYKLEKKISSQYLLCKVYTSYSLFFYNDIIHKRNINLSLLLSN